MGCNSCNTSPCCQPPQLVVDEFCQVYNTGATTVSLWTETQGQQVTVTVSANPDAAGTTNVSLFPATGTTLAYSLLPGESRTDVLNGYTGLSVVSSSTQIASGKACITVYRRFY